MGNCSGCAGSVGAPPFDVPDPHPLGAIGMNQSVNSSLPPPPPMPPSVQLPDYRDEQPGLPPLAPVRHNNQPSFVTSSWTGPAMSSSSAGPPGPANFSLPQQGCPNPNLPVLSAAAGASPVAATPAPADLNSNTSGEQNASHDGEQEENGEGETESQARTRLNKFHKTQLCVFHQMGKCKKRNSCRFAHGLQELRPLPDLFRTKLCPTLLLGQECSDPLCRYAHDPDELRDYESELAAAGMDSESENMSMAQLEPAVLDTSDWGLTYRNNPASGWLGLPPSLTQSERQLQQPQ